MGPTFSPIEQHVIFQGRNYIERVQGMITPFVVCAQLFFFKFIYLLIYLERERERELAGEGQRERDRENPEQALHCQHRARCGARIHN